MKTSFRSGRIVLGLVSLTLAVSGCKKSETPKAPAAPEAAVAVAEKKAPVVSAAVARGEYLAQSVLGCGTCHSERDYGTYAAPIKAGAAYAGVCYPPIEDGEMKMELCAPNLTSHKEAGLGAWTDAEISRAIREGKGKKGEALHPMMPYLDLRALSDNDVAAVVAYLRTLPANDKRVRRSSFPQEMRAMFDTLGGPLPGPVADVPKGKTVAYGQYLATVAQCGSCHTNNDEETPRPFAGAPAYETPNGPEVPVNLTSAGGIVTENEEAFVGRFTAMREVPAVAARKGQNNKQTMPWLSLSQLSEDDLAAIHTFLRSLKPFPNAPPSK